jgi:hypothetical protein
LNFDKVRTTAIRLVLTPQSNKAIGITEAKIFGKCDENNAVPNGVTVEEKKFITDNDLVVSYLTFKNQSDSTVTFELSTSPNRGLNEEKLGYRYILFGGNIGGTVKSFLLNQGRV